MLGFCLSYVLDSGFNKIGYTVSLPVAAAVLCLLVVYASPVFTLPFVIVAVELFFSVSPSSGSQRRTG